MSSIIRIGTRGSELALWQARYTSEKLTALGYPNELIIIKTQGDVTQTWNTAFDKLEGKGFFTKELEEALLKNEIDVAVHSHKDLPTENPPGLIVAAVSERENPAELLLIRKDCIEEKNVFQIKTGAKIGTSSARRQTQIRLFRPDLQITELRGNVPTRIDKLRKGDYDAILLAAAGVNRLKIDLSEFEAIELDPKVFVPAPAQGALAWQIREDDDKMINILNRLHHDDDAYCISLERKILNLFDGGCQLPLGVYCRTEFDENEKLFFRVNVSWAKDKNASPAQIEFDFYNTENLPERIHSALVNLRPKNIFISRDLRENDYFNRALSQLGFKVIGKSLIEFREIKFKELPKCDWVFFSSKHAVRYFFRQNPKVENARFGCVGKATATELRKFGFRADFIGQSTDTKLIGKQFSSRIGNSKVLFPSAKESLQSIQLQMNRKENAINLPVYETLKQSVEVNDAQVLVFTSPSNVESFFVKNKWREGCVAVAMGDVTKKSLEKKGVKKINTTKDFDDLGLIHSVLLSSIEKL